MRVVAVALMLFTNATCNDRSESSAVPATVWGNEAESFEFGNARALFEGVCVVGLTDGAVTIDTSGTFAAAGTLRRHGGAPPAEEVTAEQRVSFHGRVRGDVMTLSIWSSDGTKVSESKLRRGVRGISRPCP